MGKPDKSIRGVERSGFDQLLHEFLTLEHLIETGQLVTDEDLEDSELGEAEPSHTSEETSPHAELAGKESGQIAPPGTV